MRPAASAKEICSLAEQWKITPELAFKIHVAAGFLGKKLCSIISGYRTAEEQKAAAVAGRPTAADDKSTHRTCPATGADLRFGTVVADLVTPIERREFGRAVQAAGLRWGGGSKLDKNGIPSDWNHVDLGPRKV